MTASTASIPASPTMWRRSASIGFLATGVFNLLELIPPFAYGAPLNWTGLLLAVLAVFAPVFAMLAIGGLDGSPGPFDASRLGQTFVLLSIGFYATDASMVDYYEMAAHQSAWSAGLLASLFGLFLTLSLLTLGILLIRAGHLFAGLGVMLAGLAECYTTLAGIPQIFGTPGDATIIIYASAYLIAGILIAIPRQGQRR